MDAKAIIRTGLTNNQLKIIALISMTCDHVGKELLPQYTILQVIGRLAFPIFAYMIAEGCAYTRDRRKYLLSMAGLALACQLAYYLATGSLYQCVLVTFSLSAAMIFAMDQALRCPAGDKKKTVTAWCLAIAFYFCVWFVCEILPQLLANTDFAVDYGFLGVLLPLAVYFNKSKGGKILFVMLMLVLLAMEMRGIQRYALGTVPLLLLYNGERGKLKLKNLFYIYYPLHLAIIFLLSLMW